MIIFHPADKCVSSIISHITPFLIVKEMSEFNSKLLEFEMH